MIAYKLFRQLKDGNITPLFINSTQRLILNEVLIAEDHPTKGYAHRPGWHCTNKPEADHLKKEGRVWYTVKIEDYKEFKRPINQGGLWYIANKMTILEKV